MGYTPRPQPNPNLPQVKPMSLCQQGHLTESCRESGQNCRPLSSSSCALFMSTSCYNNMCCYNVLVVYSLTFIMSTAKITSNEDADFAKRNIFHIFSYESDQHYNWRAQLGKYNGKSKIPRDHKSMFKSLCILKIFGIKISS